MFAHCSPPIPDPPHVNAALRATCAAPASRAMARGPAQRYPRAAALLLDLEALLRGHTLSAVVHSERAGAGQSGREEPTVLDLPPEGQVTEPDQGGKCRRFLLAAGLLTLLVAPGTALYLVNGGAPSKEP